MTIEIDVMTFAALRSGDLFRFVLHDRVLPTICTMVGDPADDDSFWIRLGGEHVDVDDGWRKSRVVLVCSAQ